MTLYNGTACHICMAHGHIHMKGLGLCNVHTKTKCILDHPVGLYMTCSLGFEGVQLT